MKIHTCLIILALLALAIPAHPGPAADAVADLEDAVAALKARVTELESDRPDLEPEPDPTPDPPTAAGGDAPAGTAADRTAIARWNVVPWQRFDAPFAAGVVAFHPGGIDRVAFRVNGDPAGEARQATLNPRTGVVEFVIMLDPAALPPGRVEVQATAHPVDGQVKPVPVRTETTLVLFNEPAPRRVVRVGRDVLSLEAAVDQAGNGDGVVVELPAGIHRLPERVTLDGGNDRWFTVTPIPGVERGDVVLENGDGYKFGGARVKIANVKLMSHLMGNETKNAALWLDNVEYTEGNEREGTEIKRFDGGEWYTNCHIHHLRYGAGDFVRGCHFDEIGEDVLRSFYAVINTHMTNLKRPDGTSYHGDIGERPFGNDVILYGLTVRNGFVEGYEGGPDTIDGFAIVDCDIENDKAFVIGTRQDDVVFRNFYLNRSRFRGLCVMRNNERFRTPTDSFVVNDCDFNGNAFPEGWKEAGALVFQDGEVVR